jgi:hypothetical protein
MSFDQRRGRALRCIVSRAIPLFDDHGRQVRVVRPGASGVVVVEYDGSGPGVPLRNRALVRFDDGPEGEWDVSRDSILVEG